MENIGYYWPYSLQWLILGGLIYLLVFIWHARKLFRSTTRAEAWKFTVLRGICAVLLLLLITRPFLEKLETDPSAVRVVAMVDLSGSMNHLEPEDDQTRVQQIRPFLDLGSAGSWMNQARSRYAKVDRVGFSDSGIFPVRSSSWSRPEEGESTSIGDALAELLDQQGATSPAAVVLFSDGRNNTGESPLVTGEKFRQLGIPIHVVGVGQHLEYGNLSIFFADAPNQANAKEDLILRALVKNEFDQDIKTVARLFVEDEELDQIPLNLASGESRMIRFSPHTPEVAGAFTYRVVVDSLDGDSDPADDLDTQVLQVLPPPLFSALYLSHKVNQLYPFFSRSLANERFQLSSLIRLSDDAFHARGNEISTKGYPTDASFWMDYDVVLADAGCLSELNASVVSSLKDFVQSRGGGLLLFGEPGESRKLLGGLMPAIETQTSKVRQNLSLRVLPDPLFTETRRLDEWKPFLPAGLPAQLTTRVNPAARRVVGLRDKFDYSVMTLQAYGAGKSAYWGSPHDWRRVLASEKQAKEFSLFWQGIVEWLGSGTVERIKVTSDQEFGETGKSNALRVEVLGSNFQPSIDASVEANVSGPAGFSKTLQLFPTGGSLGSYAGSFLPSTPGSYRVVYNLSFPNGEKLQKLSYLKIRQLNEESKDIRYAERELRTLANLTGGDFFPVKQFDHSWQPKLSSSLPQISRKTELAEAWPIFMALFLAAGMEWVWRRRGGFL